VRTKANVMPLVLQMMEHVITITSATVTIIAIHHTHTQGSLLTIKCFIYFLTVCLLYIHIYVESNIVVT